MDCRGHSSLVQVTAAAQVAGIWVDTHECHDAGVIAVVARRVLWAVAHDHQSGLGWLAQRLDGSGRLVAHTTGWLGPAELHPDLIIANLTRRRELPSLTDGAPSVTTAHPYELEWPATTYHRCPACQFIAPAAGADHALTHEGRVDLDRPVTVRCAICGHHTDGRSHALIRTDPKSCSQCAQITYAPLYAARISCSGCRCWLLGEYVLGTTAQIDLHAVEAIRHRALADAAHAFVR